MLTYNNIASALFDFLLAPFGHELALFDLVLWPVFIGVVALVVWKYTSNQKAITRIKKQIGMHLLEIRLFRDDIAQVLKSTVTIVLKNFVYIGWNLVPMMVLLAPMVAVMVQLVSNYAYEPSKPGAVEVLRLKLDPAASVSTRDVSLGLPEGVSLDAPVVRTADGQVFWRLRANEPGDHVLAIKVGGETFDKGWAVGGEARKVPVKRLRGWEALIYPGEAALPADGPVISLELAMDIRSLDWLPDGESGLLIWVMVVSMVAGFALKDVVGVTF